MIKKRKLILGSLATLATALPITTIVSCGVKKEKTNSGETYEATDNNKRDEEVVASVEIKNDVSTEVSTNNSSPEEANDYSIDEASNNEESSIEETNQHSIDEVSTEGPTNDSSIEETNQHSIDEVSTEGPTNDSSIEEMNNYILNAQNFNEDTYETEMDKSRRKRYLSSFIKRISFTRSKIKLWKEREEQSNRDLELAKKRIQELELKIDMANEEYENAQESGDSDHIIEKKQALDIANQEKTETEENIEKIKEDLDYRVSIKEEKKSNLQSFSIRATRYPKRKIERLKKETIAAKEKAQKLWNKKRKLKDIEKYKMKTSLRNAWIKLYEDIQEIISDNDIQ